MKNWIGNRNPDDPQEGYYVGLMNACGYRTEELKKPIIGIANSFTDVNPGHRAFKQLVEFVKEGIWMAGGVPAEFNVPAPCDGMAQGAGMHTILPQRVQQQAPAVVIAHRAAEARVQSAPGGGDGQIGGSAAGVAQVTPGHVPRDKIDQHFPDAVEVQPSSLPFLPPRRRRGGPFHSMFIKPCN